MNDENLKPFRGNPFVSPIVKCYESLRNMTWGFPYLPQVIMVTVLALQIILFGFLLLTVGIASQISTMFRAQIEDSKQAMRTASNVEKSAYVMAIGIYFALIIPFWLVQMPFFILGWIWEHVRWILYLLVVTAVIIAAIIVTKPEAAVRWFERVKRSLSGEAAETPKPSNDGLLVTNTVQ